MNSKTIALAVAGLVALGAGGYFGSQYLRCQGLEEDYLNSVSAMKTSTASASIFEESDVTKALDIIRDQHMKKAEASMRGLYEQCGNRAAETAARKGTELLLP